RAGWRVVFDPLAEVKHVVGGSTRSAPYAKVVHHHRSALRFYCRRYARDPRLVMAPLVAGFLAVRGVASLARTAGGPRRPAGRPRSPAGRAARSPWPARAGTSPAVPGRSRPRPAYASGGSPAARPA